MRQLDAEQLAQAVEEELPGGDGGAEYTIGGKKKKKGGDSGLAGGMAAKTRHGKVRGRSALAEQASACALPG